MASWPPGRRVLVVEDYDQLRDLFVDGLRRAGAEVDGVGSVAEARVAGPAAYAVLVVDLRLGDAWGTDLIAEVAGGDGVPRCLLMTGGGFTHDVPDGVPVLEKPFRLADLVAAVRALLPPPG